MRKKFSPKVAAEIIETMKTGVGLPRAALLAGVAPQTVDAWRWAGRRAGRGEQFRFDLSVIRTEAGHVADAERILQQTMDLDADPDDEPVTTRRSRAKAAAAANAAMWFLERRLPEEFGRRRITVELVRREMVIDLLRFLHPRMDAATFGRVLDALLPPGRGAAEVRQLVAGTQ